MDWIKLAIRKVLTSVSTGIIISYNLALMPV